MFPGQCIERKNTNKWTPIANDTNCSDRSQYLDPRGQSLHCSNQVFQVANRHNNRSGAMSYPVITNHNQIINNLPLRNVNRNRSGILHYEEYNINVQNFKRQHSSLCYSIAQPHNRLANQEQEWNRMIRNDNSRFGHSNGNYNINISNKVGSSYTSGIQSGNKGFNRFTSLQNSSQSGLFNQNTKVPIKGINTGSYGNNVASYSRSSNLLSKYDYNNSDNTAMKNYQLEKSSGRKTKARDGGTINSNVKDRINTGYKEHIRQPVPVYIQMGNKSNCERVMGVSEITAAFVTGMNRKANSISKTTCPNVTKPSCANLWQTMGCLAVNKRQTSENTSSPSLAKEKLPAIKKTNNFENDASKVLNEEKTKKLKTVCQLSEQVNMKRSASGIDVSELNVNGKSNNGKERVNGNTLNPLQKLRNNISECTMSKENTALNMSKKAMMKVVNRRGVNESGRYDTNARTVLNKSENLKQDKLNTKEHDFNSIDRSSLPLSPIQNLVGNQVKFDGKVTLIKEDGKTSVEQLENDRKLNHKTGKVASKTLKQTHSSSGSTLRQQILEDALKLNPISRKYKKANTYQVKEQKDKLMKCSGYDFVGNKDFNGLVRSYKTKKIDTCVRQHKNDTTINNSSETDNLKHIGYSGKKASCFKADNIDEIDEQFVIKKTIAHNTDPGNRRQIISATRESPERIEEYKTMINIKAGPIVCVNERKQKTGDRKKHSKGESEEKKNKKDNMNMEKIRKKQKDNDRISVKQIVEKKETKSMKNVTKLETIELKSTDRTKQILKSTIKGFNKDSVAHMDIVENKVTQCDGKNDSILKEGKGTINSVAVNETAQGARKNEARKSIKGKQLIAEGEIKEIQTKKKSSKVKTDEIEKSTNRAIDIKELSNGNRKKRLTGNNDDKMLLRLNSSETKCLEVNSVKETSCMANNISDKGISKRRNDKQTTDTQTDYEKIARWPKCKSSKDTKFPIVSSSNSKLNSGLYKPIHVDGTRIPSTETDVRKDSLCQSLLSREKTGADEWHSKKTLNHEGQEQDLVNNKNHRRKVSSDEKSTTCKSRVKIKNNDFLNDTLVTLSNSMLNTKQKFNIKQDFNVKMKSEQDLKRKLVDKPYVNLTDKVSELGKANNELDFNPKLPNSEHSNSKKMKPTFVDEPLKKNHNRNLTNKCKVSAKVSDNGKLNVKHNFVKDSEAGTAEKKETKDKYAKNQMLKKLTEPIEYKNKTVTCTKEATKSSDEAAKPLEEIFVQKKHSSPKGSLIENIVTSKKTNPVRNPFSFVVRSIVQTQKSNALNEKKHGFNKTLFLPNKYKKDKDTSKKNASAPKVNLYEKKSLGHMCSNEVIAKLNIKPVTHSADVPKVNTSIDLYTISSHKTIHNQSNTSVVIGDQSIRNTHSIKKKKIENSADGTCKQVRPRVGPSPNGMAIDRNNDVKMCGPSDISKRIIPTLPRDQSLPSTSCYSTKLYDKELVRHPHNPQLLMNPEQPLQQKQKEVSKVGSETMSEIHKFEMNNFTKFGTFSFRNPEVSGQKYKIGATREEPNESHTSQKVGFRNETSSLQMLNMKEDKSHLETFSISSPKINCKMQPNLTIKQTNTSTISSIKQKSHHPRKNHNYSWQDIFPVPPNYYKYLTITEPSQSTLQNNSLRPDIPITRSSGSQLIYYSQDENILQTSYNCKGYEQQEVGVTPTNGADSMSDVRDVETFNKQGNTFQESQRRGNQDILGHSTAGVTKYDYTLTGDTWLQPAYVTYPVNHINSSKPTQQNTEQDEVSWYKGSKWFARNQHEERSLSSINSDPTAAFVQCSKPLQKMTRNNMSNERSSQINTGFHHSNPHCPKFSQLWMKKGNQNILLHECHSQSEIGNCQQQAFRSQSQSTHTMQNSYMEPQNPNMARVTRGTTRLQNVQDGLNRNTNMFNTHYCLYSNGNSQFPSGAHQSTTFAPQEFDRNEDCCQNMNLHIDTIVTNRPSPEITQAYMNEVDGFAHMAPCHSVTAGLSDSGSTSDISNAVNGNIEDIALSCKIQGKTESRFNPLSSSLHIAKTNMSMKKSAKNENTDAAELVPREHQMLKTGPLAQSPIKQQQVKGVDSNQAHALSTVPFLKQTVTSSEKEMSKTMSVKEQKLMFSHTQTVLGKNKPAKLTPTNVKQQKNGNTELCCKEITSNKNRTVRSNQQNPNLQDKVPCAESNIKNTAYTISNVKCNKSTLTNREVAVNQHKAVKFPVSGNKTSPCENKHSSSSLPEVTGKNINGTFTVADVKQQECGLLDINTAPPKQKDNEQSTGLVSPTSLSIQFKESSVPCVKTATGLNKKSLAECSDIKQKENAEFGHKLLSKNIIKRPFANTVQQGHVLQTKTTLTNTVPSMAVQSSTKQMGNASTSEKVVSCMATYISSTYANVEKNLFIPAIEKGHIDEPCSNVLKNKNQIEVSTISPLNKQKLKDVSERKASCRKEVTSTDDASLNEDPLISLTEESSEYLCTKLAAIKQSDKKPELLEAESALTKANNNGADNTTKDDAKNKDKLKNKKKVLSQTGFRFRMPVVVLSPLVLTDELNLMIDQYLENSRTSPSDEAKGEFDPLGFDSSKSPFWFINTPSVQGTPVLRTNKYSEVILSPPILSPCIIKEKQDPEPEQKQDLEMIETDLSKNYSHKDKYYLRQRTGLSGIGKVKRSSKRVGKILPTRMFYREKDLYESANRFLGDKFKNKLQKNNRRKRNIDTRMKPTTDKDEKKDDDNRMNVSELVLTENKPTIRNEKNKSANNKIVTKIEEEPNKNDLVRNILVKHDHNNSTKCMTVKTEDATYTGTLIENSESQKRKKKNKGKKDNSTGQRILKKIKVDEETDTTDVKVLAELANKEAEIKDISSIGSTCQYSNKTENSRKTDGIHSSSISHMPDVTKMLSPDSLIKNSTNRLDEKELNKEIENVTKNVEEMKEKVHELECLNTAKEMIDFDKSKVELEIGKVPLKRIDYLVKKKKGKKMSNDILRDFNDCIEILGEKQSDIDTKSSEQHSLNKQGPEHFLQVPTDVENRLAKSSKCEAGKLTKLSLKRKRLSSSLWTCQELQQIDDVSKIVDLYVPPEDFKPKRMHKARRTTTELTVELTDVMTERMLRNGKRRNVKNVGKEYDTSQTALAYENGLNINKSSGYTPQGEEDQKIMVQKHSIPHKRIDLNRKKKTGNIRTTHSNLEKQHENDITSVGSGDGMTIELFDTSQENLANNSREYSQKTASSSSEQNLKYKPNSKSKLESKLKKAKKLITKKVSNCLDDITICPVCEMISATNASLKDHLKLSHPYRCTVCNKDFGSKDEKFEHGWTHRSQIFYCDVCNRRFAREQLRNIHIKSKGHLAAVATASYRLQEQDATKWRKSVKWEGELNSAVNYIQEQALTGSCWKDFSLDNKHEIAVPDSRSQNIAKSLCANNMPTWENNISAWENISKWENNTSAWENQATTWQNNTSIWQDNQMVINQSNDSQFIIEIENVESLTGARNSPAEFYNNLHPIDNMAANILVDVPSDNTLQFQIGEDSQPGTYQQDNNTAGLGILASVHSMGDSNLDAVCSNTGYHGDDASQKRSVSMFVAMDEKKIEQEAFSSEEHLKHGAQEHLDDVTKQMQVVTESGETYTVFKTEDPTCTEDSLETATLCRIANSFSLARFGQQ